MTWPDLGSSRIAAITASQGIKPEREDSTDADVFTITLDPGTTVTFVAELRTPNLPQLYLWEPDAYKQKITGLTLYKGIVIGISGLLALFLTIVFVVKGAVIFPGRGGAGLGRARLCRHRFRLFPAHLSLRARGRSVCRAGAETVLAATLLSSSSPISTSTAGTCAPAMSRRGGCLPRRARRPCGVRSRRSRRASRGLLCAVAASALFCPLSRPRTGSTGRSC